MFWLGLLRIRSFGFCIIVWRKRRRFCWGGVKWVKFWLVIFWIVIFGVGFLEREDGFKRFLKYFKRYLICFFCFEVSFFWEKMFLKLLLIVFKVFSFIFFGKEEKILGEVCLIKVWRVGLGMEWWGLEKRRRDEGGKEYECGWCFKMSERSVVLLEFGKMVSFGLWLNKFIVGFNEMLFFFGFDGLFDVFEYLIFRLVKFVYCMKLLMFICLVFFLYDIDILLSLMMGFLGILLFFLVIFLILVWFMICFFLCFCLYLFCLLIYIFLFLILVIFVIYVGIFLLFLFLRMRIILIFLFLLSFFKRLEIFFWLGMFKFVIGFFNSNSIGFVSRVFVILFCLVWLDENEILGRLSKCFIFMSFVIFLIFLLLGFGWRCFKVFLYDSLFFLRRVL